MGLTHITAHYLPKPSRMTDLMAEPVHNLKFWPSARFLLMLCNAIQMFI